MTKHPVIHFLHDAGLAAWAGGALMGAVGLNGAAAQLADPAERMRASTSGWSRWAPVNAAAVAAHVVGGAGLTLVNRDRIRHQDGVAESTAVKAALTGVALGLVAWSAALNRKMAASVPVPVEGATEPGPGTPADVARTQRQLKVVQWLNPLVTGALLVSSAVHEEQQRAAVQAEGRLTGALRSPRALGAGAAVLGAGLLAARARSGRRDAQTLDVVQVDLVEVDVVDLTDGTGTAAGTAAGVTTSANSSAVPSGASSGTAG